MKSNFLDLAKNRYTTKKYNPNVKLSEETIQELKEILRLSPSSINSQPWKFSFISDEQVKTKLAEASYFNKPKVLDASHLVVFSVIDDLDAFEKHVRENLPEGSNGYYNQFIKPMSEPEIRSWLSKQVYLSLGYFLSACASLNIDSTPMEGIQNDQYDVILELDGYTTLFAVTIGSRAEDDANQPMIKPKSRLMLEDVIQTI